MLGIREFPSPGARIVHVGIFAIWLSKGGN